MIVCENFYIIEEIYPFYENLNNEILIYLSKQSDEFYNLSYKTNVKAKMSAWNLNHDCFVPLCKWVTSIIRTKIIPGVPKIHFDELWISKYDLNDYTIPHLHVPSTFSFIYFLNCPDGSSPLIFTKSRKKIKPESGKIVIFPANVLHHVPKNKCNNRIIIAGNISMPSPHPILTL